MVTPFTPGALQGWFTTWEWPFETSYLSLTSNGDLLRADLLVVFHDGSGRKPYSTVNYLSRVKPNTVAIFYRDPVRTLMYPMLRINLEVGWKVQTSASLTASAVWWDFPTVPDRFDYEIEPAAAQAYFRIRKQE